MKVTVCCGDIRVVVPCGDGEMLIKDLIAAAQSRYKKAANKLSSKIKIKSRLYSHNPIASSRDGVRDVSQYFKSVMSWYHRETITPSRNDLFVESKNVESSFALQYQQKYIHSDNPIRVEGLRNSSGAILDNDDHVRDVLEDREQIFMTFEEGILNEVEHSSPDQKISSNLIHRGPDAVLPVTEIENDSPKTMSLTPSECKLIDSVVTNDQDVEGEQKDLRTSKSLQEGLDTRDNKTGKVSKPFSRDVSRKSLGNTLSSCSWFDAQERMQTKNEIPNPRNRFSAGFELYTDPVSMEGYENNIATDSARNRAAEQNMMMFNFNPHAVNARDAEFSIATLESPAPSPRAISPKAPPRTLSKKKRSSSSISSPIVPYTVKPNAEWIGKEIKLSPIPPRMENENRIPSFNKSEAGSSVLPSNVPSNVPSSQPPVSAGSFVATVSELTDSRGVEETVVCLPSSSAYVFSPAHPKGQFLAPTNTRLLGNKISIDLIKGSSGLGFSITTRDNLAGKDCPIYIKNILPKGAAVEDGRLKAGDRLLRMNNEEMTGKSQSEAVSLLRDIPAGSKVTLLISRQGIEAQTVKSTEKLHDKNLSGPVELPHSTDILKAIPSAVKSGEDKLILKDSVQVLDSVSVNSDSNELKALDSISNNSSIRLQHPALQRTAESSGSGESRCSSLRKAKNPNSVEEYLNDMDILTFNIAVGEVGTAGLGITVQKITERGQDLGICIKSVMGGGAVSKDGRIKVNDHLVEINGVSLYGIDNSKAIEVLKSSMQSNGRVLGFLTLKVARQKVVRRRAPPVPGQREARVSASLSKLLDYDIITSGGHVTEDVAPTVECSANKSVKHDLINNKHITSVAPVSPSVNFALNSSISLFGEGSNARDSGTEVDGSKSFEKLHEAEEKSVEESLQNKDDNSDFITTDISNEDLDSPSIFSREACGRQSMSEKRKGHFDPRTFEFYQKLKGEKLDYSSVTWDPRKSAYNKSAVSKPNDLRKMIAMKKCKSLESLQTISPGGGGLAVVEELSPGPLDLIDPLTTPVKKERTKVCGGNDSFRAAVDHSYEPAGSSRDIMETVAEDGECDYITDIPLNNSGRSSSKRKFSHREKPSSPDSKTPWSIKTIANMFRMGKQTRNTDPILVEKKNSTDKTSNNKTTSIPSEIEETPKSKYRLPELKRWADRFKVKDSTKPESAVTVTQTTEQIGSPVDGPLMVKVKPADVSRMQRLRADHQRQHQERQGTYLLDEREDLIERQIREYERSQGIKSPRTPEHQTRAVRSGSAKLTSRRLSDRFKGLSSVFLNNNHERQSSNPERTRRARHLLSHSETHSDTQIEKLTHTAENQSKGSTAHSARASVDSQISNDSVLLSNSEPCEVFNYELNSNDNSYYSLQRVTSPSSEFRYCYSSLQSSSSQSAYDKTLRTSSPVDELDSRGRFSPSDSMFTPESRYESRYESLPHRYDIRNRYGNISRSAQV